MKTVGKWKACSTNGDGRRLGGCCLLAPIFSRERRHYLTVPKSGMEGLGKGTHWSGRSGYRRRMLMTRLGLQHSAVRGSRVSWGSSHDTHNFFQSYLGRFERTIIEFFVMALNVGPLAGWASKVGVIHRTYITSADHIAITIILVSV
jgi:hypothetical protein